MPTWSNWAREQSCSPVEIACPAAEAELVDVVGRAAERGLGVRAVGSGHSFTPLACTDGVMVDVSKLDRVLAADPATGLVTAEAGITLHALGPELAARGLALENQGDIDRQSLAGALATGTHGTGARFPNLSAQMVGARIVTARGEVVTVGEDDEETLSAVRVSLGALGVLSAVTLRCVPLYSLRRRDEPRPLDDTLERLDELADGADHFEFYAFPYTRTALTRTSTRGDQAPVPVPEWKLFVQERIVENAAVGLAGRTARAVPRAAPRVNRALTALVGSSTRTDHAYRVYASRRDVRFTEMEYAIPREHAREAIERILALVARRRLPVSFPLEVRFVAGDHAFLSPAQGRPTAYVAVHQYHGAEWEPYFRGVAEIMDGYGGRPHWGKRHFRTAATLRDAYPDWDAFQSVRARLDPGGRFANDHLHETLGPPAPQRNVIPSPR